MRSRATPGVSQRAPTTLALTDRHAAAPNAGERMRTVGGPHPRRGPPTEELRGPTAAGPSGVVLIPAWLFPLSSALSPLGCRALTRVDPATLQRLWLGSSWSGAGLGGLAAAARLAKLGHHLTLVERSSRLGGAVRALHRPGPRRLRVGPRSGGHDPPGRACGTCSASRADLLNARSTSLRSRSAGTCSPMAPCSTCRCSAGRASYVRSSAPSARRRLRHGNASWTTSRPTWELLRTRALEVPYAGVHRLGPRALRLLGAGRSLRALARGALPDPRARQVLDDVAVASGSDPRLTPAFVAVQAHVERTFGLWTCPGGFARVPSRWPSGSANAGSRSDSTPRSRGIVVANGAVTGVRLGTGGAGRRGPATRPRR